MSLLLTSDDGPFVFGVYATHLNEAPGPAPEPDSEAVLEQPPAPTSVAAVLASPLES